MIIADDNLRYLLTTRELTTMRIYIFLNQEFINKEYTLFNLRKGELSNLIYFMRENNEKYLDNLWNKKSIQRGFFLKAIEIYDFYSSKLLPTLGERKIYFNKNLKELLTIEKEIYTIYSLSLKRKKEFLYDDSDFTLYLINSREEENRIKWNQGDIFFHILINGVVGVKNRKLILFEEEIYMSRTLPNSEEFFSFNQDYKKIVFVVKESFLKKLKLDIKKYESKKINFMETKKLILTLLRKDKKNLNKIFIFQMATYLIELTNKESVHTFKLPYLDLKKDILNIIKENILLEHSEIINILLKHLNVSSSKLYKIFYELFGVTPLKYLEQFDIETVCNYLYTTNFSVEKICDKMFMGEFTLTNKFKKEFGMTPIQLRQQFSIN